MGRRDPATKVERPAIVALATPDAPAARAVLRASGPHLLSQSWQKLAPGLRPPSSARGMHPSAWEFLPGAVVNLQVAVFPGPHSATGEDVVEWHIPGARPLIEAALEDLHRAGLRPAEPGEFTRRAFRNGRIDLTQAEAIRDLVESHSQEEARAAAENLHGALGQPLRNARQALTQAMVQVEASLDFEEGDSQDLEPGEIDQLLQRAASALDEGLDGALRRQPTRHLGWRIGLVGAPNAGKSTLYARLTGDRALVSAEVGTTRDRREAPWRPWPSDPAAPQDWGLTDLPGRGGQAADPRDAAARARHLSADLDFQWWLVNAADPAAVLPPEAGRGDGIVVLTHADQPAALPLELRRRAQSLGPVVSVGLADPSGDQALAEATGAAWRASRRRRDHRLAVGERHRLAMKEARAGVDHALEALAAGVPLDLVAEELRRAQWALDALLGRLTPEDLLDQLFSSFCVGK